MDEIVARQRYAIKKTHKIVDGISHISRRARGAGVTAVLGPTNTGKTHLGSERMLAHSSGLIGLPLRLLAREVYNRAVERVGAESLLSQIVRMVAEAQRSRAPRP